MVSSGDPLAPMVVQHGQRICVPVKDGPDKVRYCKVSWESVRVNTGHADDDDYHIDGQAHGKATRVDITTDPGSREV